MRPLNDYNFHDAEVKFLSFDKTDLHINILNTWHVEYIKLTFENIVCFYISSNSPRMIIESVQILDSGDIDGNTLVSKCLEGSGVDRTRIPINAIYIHIAPIVGGDIVVLCRSFKFYESI